MKNVFLSLAGIFVFSGSALAGSWHGEKAYLACNPDVAEAVRRGDFSSGQEHFERYGRDENRVTDGSCVPPRGFSEREYLRCNPDVADAVRRGDFPSGRAHYRQYGFRENRKLNCRR